MSAAKYNILSLGLVFFLMACGSQSAGLPINQAQASTIAERYVQKRYPEIDRSALQSRTTDHGKYWLVAYDPPEQSVGGGPKIIVEKSTGEVAAAFMDQ